MTQEKCSACSGELPLLSDQTIQTELASLEGWAYDATEKRIHKQFKFKGYYGALSFVNMVGYLAQQQKHHPDLWVTYAAVTVNFQTHEAGGVTQNDLICAKQIEQML